MKKLTQKGFTVVEGLLIFVIVAAISGVGYYVYNQNKKTNDLAQKSDTSQPAKEEPAKEAPDETANWLLYESPGKEFKIKLADGWKLERYMQSASIIQTDNKLAIVPGQKATILEVQGGRGLNTGLVIAYQTTEELNAYQSQPRGEKRTSSKTSNGLEVTQYYYEQAEDSQGHGMQKGDKEHSYYAQNDKGRLKVSYSWPNAETDYHKEVEKVLSSIGIQ